MIWIHYQKYRLAPATTISRDFYDQVKTTDISVFISKVNSEVDLERKAFIKRYKPLHLLSKVVLILGLLVILAQFGIEKTKLHLETLDPVLSFATFYLVVPGVLILLFTGHVMSSFTHRRYLSSKRWYETRLKSIIDSSDSYEIFLLHDFPKLQTEVAELR